ncbi:MAG TPA: DUF3048 domain-containing protein [Anaerolineales bacterium]|nr:DUF3048 domain-containing protein [Anaerolineales bacterium]
MQLLRLNIALLLLLLLSSCDLAANDISLAAGVPSPTPFQPIDETASGSPYADAAPSPSVLPSVNPLPTPTEFVILPESLPTEVTVPAFTLATSLNPLTGQPASDPALLDRRPLAIKVANYPRYIRPQSGLTLADNVYEYYIEGGLTRFIAIFYGNNSEWVGPVRSGRYFDENIQRMYQAFLVFKFADPRVLDHFKLSDLADYVVVPTNGSCPPFKLMPTRNIEVYNNSYFYTPEWEDCLAGSALNNNRPVIRNGFFNELTPLSELKGEKIVTNFSFDSYNYWQYIPETQQYIRYQETDDLRNGKPEQYAPLMDNASGTQVHASNVVVLLAPHNFANTFDEEDEVYQIDLTGSGEAYVFRDGVAVPAIWYRTNTDQPLLITGADGSLLYMRPGITFYEVIGSHSYVDQDSGEWRFHHDTP